MSTTTKPITVFLPSRHHIHRPAKDYSDGLPPFDHLESPQRVEELLIGIQAARCVEVIKTDALAIEEVRQLHDVDYVDFLLAISETITPGQEYIPPCFGKDMSKAPLNFQGGMYCREIGTTIGHGTIKAALNSAHAAKLGAEHMLATQTNTISLCRPPGHHAGKRRYGGYSYFNNAYVAASILSKNTQCAVLDVDYHIGDGSLEFANEKAPYFSLHADPYVNYPYLDASTSLPSEQVELQSFRPDINGDDYIALLTELCEKINQTKPNYLILSLGFDTLGTDYIQDEYINLVPDDFGRIAKTINQLDIPILVVLEGGYDLPNLYDCGKAFAQHI